VEHKNSRMVVEARGVTRRYGTVAALDGLTLALPAGVVTTLLGPNGAGKTTLVSLLLGRTQPHAGTVSVFGEAAGSLAARRRTGAMLQSAALAPQLTVAEHVALHGGYYANPRPLDETLAHAGLQALAHRKYSALSGGEQRRVQFALAVAGRPDFLVLDEPTVAMDADSRRAFWRVVRGLADEGAAVLLTTHQLEEAEALSDRVVLVAKGRVLAEGTPGEIRARVGARTIRCLTSLAPAQLAALPGVAAVEASGRHQVLRSSTAEDTLRALLAADAGLADLSVGGASLEEAVLDLLRTESTKEVA
jgi:ABC-2 type transport system ATP-binding protein